MLKKYEWWFQSMQWSVYHATLKLKIFSNKIYVKVKAYVKRMLFRLKNTQNLENLSNLCICGISYKPKWQDHIFKPLSVASFYLHPRQSMTMSLFNIFILTATDWQQTLLNVHCPHPVLWSQRLTSMKIFLWPLTNVLYT